MSWPEDMSGGEPWVEHRPVDAPRSAAEPPTDVTYRPYDPDAPAPPSAPGSARRLGVAISLTCVAAAGLLIAAALAAFAAFTVSTSEIDGNGYVVVTALVIGVPAAAVAVIAGVAAGICWWQYRRGGT